MGRFHQPVLLEEVLDALALKPRGVYVDGTLGTGGHALAIGNRLDRDGLLIGLDVDEEAVEVATRRLETLQCKWRVFKKSYADIDALLDSLNIAGVDGIVLDLGMSSFQLDQSGRGFSFSRDEPLDMRMDPSSSSPTAADLVNSLSEKELEDLLRHYGEERYARRISKKIVESRYKAPIRTSSQLASLVRAVYPQPRGPVPRHPATRTFQALRIAVNRELENLESFLERAPDVLKQGGRLVILTYHSLEDRVVKQRFASWEKGCTCPPDFPQCVCGKRPLMKRVFKKAKRPDKKEVISNPRARSAILRAAERV